MWGVVFVALGIEKACLGKLVGGNGGLYLSLICIALQTMHGVEGDRVEPPAGIC